MKLFKLSIVALAVAGLTACSLEGDDGNDGAAGVDGSNGLNSLTVQTALAVGDTNCPNSGVQFDSGLDTNADGTLGSDEITDTSYVCSPGSSEVATGELLTTLNNDWFIAASAEVENNKQVWMDPAVRAQPAPRRQARPQALKTPKLWAPTSWPSA